MLKLKYKDCKDMEPEVVGLIAAVIIFASFVLKGETKIRIVNLIGSVVFVAYGFMISNFVLAFMGIAIVLVHCVHFWHRMKERKAAKALSKAEDRAMQAEAKVDAQLGIKERPSVEDAGF